MNTTEHTYDFLKPYERPECYIGATWYGYYTVAGRNRDSDILTNSNHDCWLKFLTELLGPVDTVIGKESDPQQGAMFKSDEDDRDDILNWTVCRESHWACGWIELIRVSELVGHEKLLKIDAQLKRLDDYLVFSDDHYSNAEQEEYYRCWQHAGADDDFRREITREFLKGNEERTEEERDELSLMLDKLDAVSVDDLIALHEKMRPSGEYHTDGWPDTHRSAEAMSWEDLEELVATIKHQDER